MLNKITITGPDNSVQPADLLKLSTEYPFVEWGILLSRKRQGEPEYPTKDWLQILHALSASEKMNISGHLCGARVRELLVGNAAFVNELGRTIEMFQRIQVNTVGEQLHYDEDKMVALVKRLDNIKFIFPAAPVGNQNPGSICEEHGVQVDVLFDTSFGKGELPEHWPSPFVGSIYCGYAGGLNPENLAEQLRKIEEVAGETPVWIDMQSGVRSDDRKTFDLQKVRAVLEIFKAHYKEEVPAFKRNFKPDSSWLDEPANTAPIPTFKDGSEQIPPVKKGYPAPALGTIQGADGSLFKILEAQDLEAMLPGARIATGVTNEPQLSKDGDVRWVAIRGGGIPDWTIYFMPDHMDVETVAKEGDKVTFEAIIRKLIPCTDEAYALYRM